MCFPWCFSAGQLAKLLLDLWTISRLEKNAKFAVAIWYESCLSCLLMCELVLRVFVIFRRLLSAKHGRYHYLLALHGGVRAWIDQTHNSIPVTTMTESNWSTSKLPACIVPYGKTIFVHGLYKRTNGGLFDLSKGKNKKAQPCICGFCFAWGREIGDVLISFAAL